MLARLALSLIAFGALVACNSETQETGGMIFAENCAACHGDDARGSGRSVGYPSRQMPDLTLLSRNNGGVFPRDQVMSTIDGFDRGAHFAPEMPEFGLGDLGPAVNIETEDGLGTPIPQRLILLASYLEDLQRD